ncbi:ATP-binding cassette domain-containing protein [Campylobacter jejuni]|nr:ATP-binding cassette domain-containing protein [Campylobacter jejuni]WLQ75837.1 ATP-binding cassette domain-containing protein [Campylobacter jejuni]WLQ78728.1 ATP-binding cassette domain-containing protein [Campylobacter jejuni]WLQ82976.1 ATP-binding cassette domain-containing protein [Campylobacter jejuni]WLQ85944.1 ATP-binding cassette domain-containing protein [Campylobacter jejuni]
MVEVKNLTMRFANQLLFENVNLRLVRGQRYGLIGANGAGKSTFLKFFQEKLSQIVVK